MPITKKYVTEEHLDKRLTYLEKQLDKKLDEKLDERFAKQKSEMVDIKDEIMSELKKIRENDEAQSQLSNPKKTHASIQVSPL